MNREDRRQWVARLYAAYADEIYRVCLVILREPHAAEDALQECFLKVQRTERMPRAGKERAWLMSIARNTAYDELRHRSRVQPVGDDVLSARREEPPRWAYIELLDGLNEVERDIVTLYIVGGLNLKEIAGMLGLSVHGTRKRYERALEKLRHDLEENI